MSLATLFDLLDRFAEIERLVSKIYFRFSHLFLHHSELRDFWWQMGVEEDQHGNILLACKEIIKNFSDDQLDPMISRQAADEIKERLTRYLSEGTPAITVEEAFRTALEIETSEIDAIYGKLVQLGGPEVATTMENLGVPASVQRQRLKSALRRFTRNSELLVAAERL